MVLVAPVEIRLTANWLDAERSSSANLMRNRICFSAGPSATCRLFTTGFREGRGQRGGPVGNIFVRYPPGERKRIARGLNVDVLGGEGLLEQLAQRLQVLLHGDVIEVALAGLAPNHQRDRSERLCHGPELRAR